MSGNRHRGFESLPLRQPLPGPHRVARAGMAGARSSVDRASGCGPEGRGFESRRARHILMPNLPTLPTLPDELVAGFGAPWPALLEQAGPSTIVPVWATVELDRAAASIAIASRSTAVLDTPLLGARVRVIDLVP